MGERLAGRLHPKGTDGMLYTVQLLSELGIPWRSAGGNELRVPADVFARMPAEYLDEVAEVVRDAVPRPEPAQASSVGADPAGGGAAAPPAGPPPRTGPGSSRDAWAQWAEQNSVVVPEGAARDEIIDLMEAHDRGS